MSRQALIALLDWYVESGVDLALDEAPHDRYADSTITPAAVKASEPPLPVTLPETRPAPPPTA